MKKIDVSNMNGDMQSSPYLTYGIQEVEIKDFVVNEQGSIPSMDLTMTDFSGTKSASSRFYFPEGAEEADTKTYQRSVYQIKHIATKVVNSTEFDQAYEMSANLSQFAINLNKLLAGKRLRIKFSGKEIAGKDGKQNWFKAVISGMNFAESLSTNPTKLKFDPNNQYDVKRLTVPTDMSTVSIPVTAPF